MHTSKINYINHKIYGLSMRIHIHESMIFVRKILKKTDRKLEIIKINIIEESIVNYHL